jgi:hypothetical protein
MDNILRTWTFWIHLALQEECREDLEVCVLKRMRQAPGNQRASALFRDVGDGTLEVVVLSVWDSIDKIKEFAGPNYLQPTISSDHEAKVFDREPTVRHYPIGEAPLWLLKATSG